MIITSDNQRIIQISPCLLKLSLKQESVMDGQTDRQRDRQTDGRTDSRYYYIPSPLSRADKKILANENITALINLKLLLSSDHVTYMKFIDN